MFDFIYSCENGNCNKGQLWFGDECVPYEEFNSFLRIKHDEATMKNNKGQIDFWKRNFEKALLKKTNKKELTWACTVKPLLHVSI